MWLRKCTVIDLTECNANHMILSYCNLPISCGSVVGQLTLMGAVSYRLFMYISNGKFVEFRPEEHDGNLHIYKGWGLSHGNFFLASLIDHEET